MYVCCLHLCMCTCMYACVVRVYLAYNHCDAAIFVVVITSTVGAAGCCCALRLLVTVGVWTVAIANHRPDMNRIWNWMSVLLVVSSGVQFEGVLLVIVEHSVLLLENNWNNVEIALERKVIKKNVEFWIVFPNWCFSSTPE